MSVKRTEADENGRGQMQRGVLGINFHYFFFGSEF